MKNHLKFSIGAMKMLTIRPEHSVMPKNAFDFSLNETAEQDKIQKFITLLAEKINNNPTLEKVMFFHLFKDYTLNDDIEFHFETKNRFLKNFIFEHKNGSVKRKNYDYVNPFQLSLYVPEFYHVINEIFLGDDVPMPVFESMSSSAVNYEEIEKFWNALKPEISKLEEEPSNNFATLLLVKWLKEGGDNICISDAGFFYSSFRKVDVLENDNISIEIEFPSKNPAYNIQRNFEHPCKDMLVWKLLNASPYPYNKKIHQHIVLNKDFMNKLEEVLESHKVA